MSRPAVLGLTLLIGALALFVLWLLPAGRGASERAEHGSMPLEKLESSGQPSLLHPGEVGAKPDSPVGAAGAEGEAARTAQRAVPADGRPRISGTVRVPGGIPPGEELEVSARVSAKSGSTQTLATRVASDGSFTLVVPEDTESARLGLESRFLRLPGTVKARPGEEGVLLEPCVYAAIEGQVAPPQSMSTLGVSWVDMAVSWSFDPRSDLGAETEYCAIRSPTRDRLARPDDDGVFALSLVPAGVELDLHAENPFGPDWSQRVGPLEPVEQLSIVIALELGISISGRVIDEHGQPVEGVEVSYAERERNGRPWNGRTMDTLRTDAGGRFVLVRMPRRVLEIFTRGKDLAREAEATVDGTAGDVRELLLSVVRGGCIEGTVRWPDGSAVEGFDIRASGPSYEGKYLEGSRFRLCGLSDGSYRVEVRALRDGIAGTAWCDGIRTGEAPIDLVLTEGRVFDVRGVVVDEKGKPIDEHSVQATRLDSEARMRTAEESQDGTFALVALEPGAWGIEAEASGYESTSQRVVVGEDGPPPLRLVLRQAGRIRGRVLDAVGAPVPRAWVCEEEDAFQFALAESEDGTTDADGRFEFQPSSIRARILAGKRGFSPSEVQELEVGSGGTVEGVVLRLRESCRAEGRVLDERGDPLPGVSVWVESSLSAVFSAEADARGAFQLDGLPPGAALLFAYHPSRDGFATATVTFSTGQPASVDLRFESTDPVRFRGRVTRGGKPVECGLGLLTRGFAAECASDSDGRFEVTLQRPGAWRGAVWLTRDSISLPDLARFDVRRFEVTIPDADEHAFELDFDVLPRLTSREELLR